jgi:hypothetical protein
VNWNNDNASYGGAYVFARYLYDHYGSLVTTGVNRHAYGGTKAITDVVGGAFGDVFRSFAASLALSYYDLTSPDARLGFPSGFMLPDNTKGFFLDAGVTDYVDTIVAPWGLTFFWIEGGGPNKRQHISIDASIAGKYGAVVVTGF